MPESAMPEKAIDKFMFYGAGQYAKKNLGAWLVRGLVPLCFSDADEGLHYKKISPLKPARTEFDILPLKEALELCPDADIYVTINIEADPRAYDDIRDYIISHGVAPERVGPVPSEPNGKKCIFYGIGQNARIYLERWVLSGIVPICFADSNPKKHHTVMRISTANVDGEFDILPIHEALGRYPDAFLFITTDPESYDSTYETLLAKGVPPGRIGAPPQHCPLVGHQFVLNGSSTFCICYQYGNDENIQAVGKIKEDVQNYYAHCGQLRDDLNKGKLTSCTGCPSLRLGPSSEELAINVVCLGSGMPGATKCNFNCFYCVHGLNYEKKGYGRRDELDNILEILQYFAKNEDLHFLNYAAAEITISPYRAEILKLLKENKWRGVFNSNASCYIEELKDLLSEKDFYLLVSLDSGTPDTFAKLKGVDAFHKVVDNLKKYASSGGLIRLKYVVLNDINCGKADLNGFIAIAKSLNAMIAFSWDIRSNYTSYSDGQYDAISYMVRQCISSNIPFYFPYNTPEYRDRLEKDGLYPSKK
ncbi:MAG: radical SAM protein [Holophagales bacterium]|jgi:sulfatase maturation enzyme AslB (radical SAM superfamily)|nr:radical SAM protein [Holophagales bacterium]